MLIALAGLPGSGKTTLGRALAETRGCPLLSVDTAETAMWRAGISRSEPTHVAAYVVVAALAAEQLMAGHDVVIDAVNGPELARAHWRDLATAVGVPVRFLVLVCSDPSTHQQRLAARQRSGGEYPSPSWEGVLRRKAEFPPWADEHLLLDTMSPVPDNLETALDYLQP